MTDKLLKNYLVNTNVTLVDALTRIDSNKHKTLFVVDDDNKLLGTVTDGDIRRWIMKHGGTDGCVADFMNKNPRYIFQNEANQAALVMKKHQIFAVPVLDANLKLVDICFDDVSNPIREMGLDNSLADIPVVIMAGGKGTRLYPFTKILPKPLIPIGDIPIIERIIDKFCDYGAKDYYLTVNYKKNMIKSYFTEVNPDYNLYYVEEDKPLGTAGSIRLIEDKFNTPVIVTNCDVLIEAEYNKILKYHQESGNGITIVAALKNIVVPYGVLKAKSKGVIESMEEKPRLSYFINTGMYVLNPDLLQRIPADVVYHMPDLAEKMMQEGKKVGMYPISEDSFLDMGQFEEMKRMEEKLDLK